MLSVEDNDLLTRIGPGTPMGDLVRQYWIPALLSSELPSPDSDPMRVRLVGEDLIAFRDSHGTVGVLANNCPHRGASLFFGRCNRFLDRGVIDLLSGFLRLRAFAISNSKFWLKGISP